MKQLTPTLALVVLTALPLSAARAQLTCTETEVALATEDFDDITYKDPLTSAEGWDTNASTPLRLARKGNTFNTSGESFGVRVFVAGPGDFNGDGHNDMVAQLLSPECHLHFLENTRDVSGDFMGFSAGGEPGTTGFNAYRIDTPSTCDANSPSVLTGDYDADGDTDFVYLNMQDESSDGTIVLASLYENLGGSGLNFAAPVEITSQFNSGTFVPAAHWTSGYFDVVDWDGDDDDDILIGSSYGSVARVLLYRSNGDGSFAPAQVLLADSGLTGPFAGEGVTASGGCSGNRRGINGLAAADFDQDGDFDLVIGSVSQANLMHWENDGSGNFTRLPDISFAEAGVTFIQTSDFDGDGDPDLMVGRDGWNCGGTGGDVYYFDNDGLGNFARRATAVISGGDDLDIGIAFDIDTDDDAAPDLIAADGNNSGTYSQMLSTRSGIYNLDGTAVSKVIELDQLTQAFTRVNININNAASGSPYTPPSGTAYEFYVSSNDGQDWELVPNEYLDGSQDFTFTNFGSKLRWRIEMTASEATLPSEDAIFAPAATETPEIATVALTYYWVDRRLYSRSGLDIAAGLTLSDGSEGDLLFGTAFYYPGFEGFLYAYNITSFNRDASGDFDGTAGSTAFTSVADDTDVSVEWEAGEALKSVGGGNRVIYTARDADGDGRVDDRLNFETLNSAVLAPIMALTETEANTLITYVRNGMDHPAQTFNGRDLTNWKLYDAGHSSPVFVGAPRQDETYPAYADNNYEAFKNDSTVSSRDRIVLIASNAGMVHAFDAATGAEKWTFIPYNLLNRLQNQRVVDGDGNVEYEHQFMVDGQLQVQDIYDPVAAKWRTVLIAGQAQGQGRGDNNYYFALDITDTNDPIPLWEFTDPWDNTIEECTGTNPIEVITTTCAENCVDDCNATDHVFGETSAGNIYIEAEQFNATSSIDGIHTFEVQTSCPVGNNGNGVSGDCVVPVPASTTNCDTAPAPCGAQLVYEFVTLTAGNYRVFVRGLGPDNYKNSFRVAIDETSPARVNLDDNNTWDWITDIDNTTYYLAEGDHTLTVYMREDSSVADKFLITTASTAPADSDLGPAPTCRAQCTNVCSPTATEVTLGDSDEWPECGVGDNERCCIGEVNVCHPLGSACPEVGTASGETWSRPAVGRARVAGSPRFLAFFGSGYDNLPSAPDRVGRTVYAIDAVTGELVKRWTFDDIPEGAANPSTIPNTVPGSVELLDAFDPNDADAGPDGYVDRLYVGDLEGRLWKIELDEDGLYSGSEVSDASWPACVLFDAGDPDRDGTRTWAPVITKPAVAFPQRNVDFPHVYFGTGGDDRVPDEVNGTPVQQRFYAIRDDLDCGLTPYDTDALIDITDLTIDDLEWVVGDGKEPDFTTDLDPADREGVPEDRYWSDPVVLDNTIVFFASLPGKIESVNPCDNIDGGSRFYGYAARNFFDITANVQVAAGTSIFANDTPYLASDSKIRQAVVIRWPSPTSPGGGGSPSGPTVRTEIPASVDVTDVFVQEFAAGNTEAPRPLAISTQQIGQPSTTLKVTSWREITLP